MSDGEIILSGRLDGSQRNRLGSLLNMLYKPSELAEEVGFSVRQVYRVYIPLGLPHERDSSRHIWINGETFRGWIEQTYPKRKMREDESFCLTCKKPVKIIKAAKKNKGEITYFISTCTNCGRTLTRIIENRRGRLD